MAEFEPAVEKVLAREGGYVDHPSDPGGATNFGISSRWMQRADVTDPAHPRDLTRARAIELYEQYFWLPYGYATRPQAIAEKLFDITVNAGPAVATKILQRALRAHGHQEVVDDGVVGPITEAALAKYTGDVPMVLENVAALAMAMRSEQAGFYRSLVAADARRKVFLRGWLRRAYDEG